MNTDSSNPEDDGLLIPEVRRWSRDKHHFLSRYIDAFTTAMNKKKWSGLHYIDPFAGAGIERVKETGELTWGSPLIAARARYPFRRIHVCEVDGDKHRALAQRIRAIRSSHEDQILHGDANQLILTIVETIPDHSLSLAFLDPYGLHLDYRTIECISKVRADLIVYFPDRIDALRNWRAYYWGNPDSNLDAVLGPGCDWRKALDRAPEDQKVRVLLELYLSQIRRPGYNRFEWEPVPSSGPRYYWLVFCSKADVAAKIWRGIAAKKSDGQCTWDFGGS